MRMVKTYVLRFFYDPDDLEMKRGTIQAIVSNKTYSFTSIDGLLDLLENMSKQKEINCSKPGFDP